MDMHAETKPTYLAICYDFDKTLTPTDMQNQGFIQAVDKDVNDFWQESNALAKNNDMDQNLAYMYSMQNESLGKLLFTKDKLTNLGTNIELYKGVKNWFDRINKYAKKHNIVVEHYIISSGLKEIIEGTPIATHFKKIYASSFLYDKNGLAVWPAQVVNYTDKTQYLFRIEKGVLDVNDQSVNNYISPSRIRIPFRNIIYIGDSATDIPCMKLVNINGGHSIGVFNPETNDKEKVFHLLEENRIKYFAEADYSNGSNLDTLIKRIIDRTETNEVLEQIHFQCVSVRDKETEAQDAASRARRLLINRLEDSRTFATTHSVINELEKIPISEWTESDKRRLGEIKENNSQVSQIQNDPDIKRFFRSLDNKYDF